jgi:hypothetical protein
MSLTSYRAAPPRVRVLDRHVARTSDGFDGGRRPGACVRGVGGPGGDLLSHVLRRSTIGAEGFHGRVRDGIGCGPLAMTTRSTNRPRGRRLTPLCVFEDIRGLGAMRLTDACAVCCASFLRACCCAGRIRSKNKPIERLVRLSFTRCRASTRLLSTGWSVPALGECLF